MGLREKASAWLRRRAPAVEPAPGPRHDVFLLNAALNIPTTIAARSCAGDAGAPAYLLDYNYIDRQRALDGFAALPRLVDERRLPLADRTLLLAIKGLHPVGDQLLAFARRFAHHHVFFEVWNGIRELVHLAEAGLEHLYVLPVAQRLQLVGGKRVAAQPNRRVFVSLGGDDDLELIAAAIAACPDLHFCVPTVSWGKPGSDKRFSAVSLPGANVSPVDCDAVHRDQQLAFTPAYRAAYESCDTVLIATRREKMFQMRGGVRMADALWARKRIVVTENVPCQLLMAQPERTCLVAAHDAGDVAAQLARITTEQFQVDAPLFEAVRALTDEPAKLEFMVAAAADPATARRSPFSRVDDPIGAARRVLLPAGQALLDRAIQEEANDRR